MVERFFVFRHTRMSTRDIVLILAVVIVWGLNFPVIRITLGGLPPLLIVAARYALVCLPLIGFFRKPPIPLRYLVAYGLVLGTVHQGALFLGIRAGLGAGISSLVLQTQVFFTLALAVAFLGERVMPNQIAGLVLGTIGLTLVAVHSGQSASLVGFALVLASAVTWSIATLISKRAYAAATGPVNPLGFIVWASAFPIVPTLALSIGIDGLAAHTSALAQLSAQIVSGVLFIAIGSTLFGFVVWNWLISKYGAGFTSQFGLLVPIVGLASSALILGETITLVKALAAAFVIVGLAISIFGGRMFASLAQTTANRRIQRSSRGA
jgi:O-acetylserine/cysteine efflux transporter